MDEMWQRHKSFILQVFVGAVVFLVAFMVMRSTYGDANDPAQIRKKNQSRLNDLKDKLQKGKAPAQSSIAQERGVADGADRSKWELAKRVASIAGTDRKMSESDRDRAYVRENINLTLALIGQEDTGGALAATYDQQPQTCLSGVANKARSAVGGQAAQTGKDVESSLGVGAFAEEDIPEALHGLMIVTDVVKRCLARPRVDKVQNIAITARTTFPSNALEFPVNSVSAVGVTMELVGDPTDVSEVIRSFNVPGKADRMIVLESVEYVQPLSADEDTVRAKIRAVGLRYKAERTEGVK
jgi:hypothetical protein